jgi:hypothetical protein
MEVKIMQIFKNIINDAVDYNDLIERYNSKGKPKIPQMGKVEINKVITISLEEYKELLIYKGKYLGLTGITEITKLYADEVEDGVKDDNKNSK